jgi:hypothetical protein
MPVVNIVTLGFILLFFGSFMVALAWGAWCTRGTTKLSRARSISVAQTHYVGRGLELSPVKIRS